MTSDVDCRCTMWVKGLTYNLARPVAMYEVKPCRHRATVRIGSLDCCSIHARMVRDGFVSQRGETLDPNARAEVKRYPKKWPDGYYSWAKNANETPIKR